MAERITREFAESFPAFASPEEAYTYLRGIYGKDISYQGCTMIDGSECWFCNLIIDREVYESGAKDLRMGTLGMSAEFEKSYQPLRLYNDHVEIFY